MVNDLTLLIGNPLGAVMLFVLIFGGIAAFFQAFIFVYRIVKEKRDKNV